MCICVFDIRSGRVNQLSNVVPLLAVYNFTVFQNLLQREVMLWENTMLANNGLDYITYVLWNVNVRYTVC